MYVYKVVGLEHVLSGFDDLDLGLYGPGFGLASADF